MFKIFIMPHYDYCASLFMKQNSKFDQDRLLKNFNKTILRLLKVNLYNLTIEEQLKKLSSLKLNILPILLRLFTHFCLFFYTLSSNKHIELQNKFIINRNNTRQYYSIPDHRGSKFFLNSFIYIASSIFNELHKKNDQEVKDEDKFMKKKYKLKKYFEKNDNLMTIYTKTSQFHGYNN
jgi:hypothetical protein